MRLKRAAYRHIEAEIYAYQDTLKAIDELRQDIILAGRQENSYAAVVGDRYAGTSLIFDRPPISPENVGVAIELKRQKGGRVTPEQTAWLEHLKARGVGRGSMPGGYGGHSIPTRAGVWGVE